MCVCFGVCGGGGGGGGGVCYTGFSLKCDREVLFRSHRENFDVFFFFSQTKPRFYF